MRAFVSRVSVVAGVCLTGPFLAMTPASANTDVEQPAMYFTFAPSATSHQLCAVGTLRNPPSPSPQWTLDVNGVRVGGTRIEDSAATTTQNALLCLTIAKLGAVAGTYTATFQYHAVPADPPSEIVAQVTWYPGDDTIAGTGQ